MDVNRKYKRIVMGWPLSSHSTTNCSIAETAEQAKKCTPPYTPNVWWKFWLSTDSTFLCIPYENPSNPEFYTIK